MTTCKETTCKDFLDKIGQRAQELWGKQWRAELAKEYVAIARERGDESADYENRRKQVYQIFEKGSCSVESLLILTQCVGCRIQMACDVVEIFE
jgi:hypothetical protein